MSILSCPAQDFNRKGDLAFPTGNHLDERGAVAVELAAPTPPMPASASSVAGLRSAISRKVRRGRSRRAGLAPRPPARGAARATPRTADRAGLAPARPAPRVARGGSTISTFRSPLRIGRRRAEDRPPCSSRAGAARLQRAGERLDSGAPRRRRCRTRSAGRARAAAPRRSGGRSALLQVAEAEALLGAIRRGEQLARELGGVDRARRLEAVVAIAAALGRILAEMPQQDRPAAAGGLDQRGQRVEPLRSPPRRASSTSPSRRRACAKSSAPHSQASAGSPSRPARPVSW